MGFCIYAGGGWVSPWTILHNEVGEHELEGVGCKVKATRGPRQRSLHPTTCLACVASSASWVIVVRVYYCMGWQVCSGPGCCSVRLVMSSCLSS